MFWVQQGTVAHIVSMCTALAADQYPNRHIKVAAQLHVDTCEHYGIKAEAEHWYQHEADQVLDMRNRDPHRENVKNILAISLLIMTMQHIRESPPASHAMRKSAWND